MLDKNIGASRVAQHKNDELAYGSLYQWGRESDGHECWRSETTDIKSNSDKPGYSKFIVLK